MPNIPPPPNYLSRRFQLKMLSLFAALALVIVLMSVARKPQNWDWFFRIGATSTGTRHVDTRVRPPTSPETTPLVSGEDIPARADAPAEQRAWWQVIDALNDRARRHLEQLIWNTLSGENAALEPELQERLLSDLDRNWSSVLAAQSSAGDSADDQPESSPRSAELGQRWQLWRELLTRAARGDKLSESEQQVLGELDALFDRIACRQIRDNTSHRRSEVMAWERLLAKLKRTPADRLASASPGNVAFLQLFDQGRVYRCRLVTISGYVRRIERVPSKLEMLQIEVLYRLWLKPADGTDAPFVVYCLELPPSLPRPTKDQPVIQREPPGELVTCHAYFFKNWLYQGTNRTAYLAPLLLTRAPLYDAPPTPADQPADSDPWTVIIYSAIAAACIALVVTWYAWRYRPEAPTSSALQKLQQLRAARGEQVTDVEDEEPNFDGLLENEEEGWEGEG